MNRPPRNSPRASSRRSSREVRATGAASRPLGSQAARTSRPSAAAACARRAPPTQRRPPARTCAPGPSDPNRPCRTAPRAVNGVRSRRACADQPAPAAHADPRSCRSSSSPRRPVPRAPPRPASAEAAWPPRFHQRSSRRVPADTAATACAPAVRCDAPGTCVSADQRRTLRRASSAIGVARTGAAPRSRVCDRAHRAASRRSVRRDSAHPARPARTR